MKLVQVEVMKSRELGIKENDIEEAVVLEPSILNLPAKVRVIAQQRRHSRAGVLDLLLQTEDQQTRYVVEIQLGVLDESHIVRTIEYWDIERRNNPGYTHVAVIVAEGIGRFLNVIGLLAGRIPIIVINMTMFRNDQNAGVLFSTVIDQTDSADEDEALSVGSRSREQWVNENSEEKICRIESICGMLSNNRIAPRFNVLSYIALGNKNQATFYPQARSILMTSLLDQSDEIDTYLHNKCVDTLPYDSKGRRYRVYLSVDKSTPEEVEVLKYLGGKIFPGEAQDEA